VRAASGINGSGDSDRNWDRDGNGNGHCYRSSSHGARNSYR